ncbi:hypothetical protein AXG93_4118s1130 [Marchantia polymorpha subsp. ruderalis]|uniref:Uncharacterized protein n=1 Tax=Marchantia polymorpha subsp. ruderalis TaxID=1480154 RepID=A0A176W2I8_MARPO|nr:hypothetical protein AXG93_4118s1130 [Marchantia polymorpha subsp. ruderalis]
MRDLGRWVRGTRRLHSWPSHCQWGRGQDSDGAHARLLPCVAPQKEDPPQLRLLLHLHLPGCSLASRTPLASAERDLLLPVLVVAHGQRFRRWRIIVVASGAAVRSSGGPAAGRGTGGGRARTRLWWMRGGNEKRNAAELIVRLSVLGAGA